VAVSFVAQTVVKRERTIAMILFIAPKPELGESAVSGFEGKSITICWAEAVVLPNNP